MKIAYVIAATALLIGSCKPSERKAPNGLAIEVIREGTGDVARPGQFIIMNLLYKDAKDSVYNDTRVQNIPIAMAIPDSAGMAEEKGLESAFRVLKKGDSVRIIVSARSFYEDSYRQPIPSNLQPESNLTFLIGVADILDREGLGQLREKIQAREAEKYRKQQETQLATDTTAIDLYLSNNNIAAQKDKSGLRYVITKLGSGAKPTLESVIVVSYKGSFLTDGRVFDQSAAPVEYPLAQFIQGWQVGFQLLPVGTKATFYIPSSLAYGAAGYPPDIPANANLVFEVELFGIK